MEMMTSYLLTAVLAAFSLIVHFEAITQIRILLDRIKESAHKPLPRHVPVVMAVGACLLAHGIEIWGFGTGYFLLASVLDSGAFGGDVRAEGFLDFVYFSAVTYTSLGVGDLFPLQHLRLMAGVEALIGLMLIGWTSYFTYETLSQNQQSA